MAEFGPRTVRLDDHPGWQRWVGDNRRRFSTVSYDPEKQCVIFMCHESYDRLPIYVGPPPGDATSESAAEPVLRCTCGHRKERHAGGYMGCGKPLCLCMEFRR